MNSQNSLFTFSVKEMYDYQGRSYLHVPQDVGVNLRSTVPPEKCYLPKKQIHVWSGHTKVGIFVSVEHNNPFNFLSAASNLYKTEKSVEGKSVFLFTILCVYLADLHAQGVCLFHCSCLAACAF